MLELVRRSTVIAVAALCAAPAVAQVTLTPFASGFTRPVEIKHAGDARLFVIEKSGYIRIVRANGTVEPTPFLDLHLLVAGGNEEGLLGLAFHPNYASNGRFFVYYVNTSGNIQVVRYTVSGNPDLADAGSALPILGIPHPTNSNHNGGGLHFGPDGFLYISTGDGGSGCDPDDNGQDPNALLGKLLRIDIDSGTPYAIPPSNPFVGPDGVADEIWALGLRNPWRFSFDRANGNLYIGDVGQGQREEIDFAPAGDSGGQNYGWDCFEGSQPASISGCSTTAVCTPISAFTFPVHEYTHSDGCSITGGYVYRGSAAPSLVGTYFYSDYCSNEIWGLTTPDNGGTWNNESFGVVQSGLNPTAFGENAAGELFVASDGGTIYQIGSSAPPSACPSSPASGCVAAGKSKLLLDHPGDNTKNRLLWKWLKGPAVDVSDFGDPTASTAYTLCVYAGTAAFDVQVGIPAATDWSTTGTGFKYNSSSNADGASKLLLKSGADGKSKIVLKGKGANLDLEALLDILSITPTTFTVQLLRSDSSECWEAPYPSIFIDHNPPDVTIKAKYPNPY
jgi:glucose/arabinose dehydrogenase